MKKLVALTTLASVLTAAGASAYQNGFHAGANLAYVNTTSRQQVTGTRSAGYTFSDQSPALLLEGNYGVLECNLYKAVDLRVGYIFSKKKRAGAQLNQGFSSGVGFRLGTPVSEKTILFGRLALDANQQKFSYNFTDANGTSRHSDTFFDYALAPGVGVMWELSDKTSFNVLYQYTMSFATRGYNGNEHKFSDTPSAHHLGIGFSYAI
jgi:hypothetical protein